MYGKLQPIADFINVMDELAEIAELSFDDHDQASARLKAIENQIPHKFFYLKSCIEFQICHHAWDEARSRKSKPPMEKVIEKKFYENLSSYLPGAEIHDFGPISGKTPDGFVKYNNEPHVVEVKRHKFGRSALGQLIEYLEIFGLKKGIAVAPQLTCKLPSHITFIEVTA